MSRRGGVRTFVALVLVAFSSALAACGLFLDFSGFDTSDPVNDGGGAFSEAMVGPAGSFTLHADDLRVEPGTSALLTVTILRTTDDELVTVTAGSDLPSGQLVITPITVDPDATSAALVVTVDRNAPPSVSNLQLTATGRSGSRTATIRLTLRGPSCGVDRGFGENNGVVHVTALVAKLQVNTGTLIAADGGAITAISSNPDPSPAATIRRFHGDAGSQWTRGFPTGVQVAAVDPAGGVFLAEASSVDHLLGNGARDPTFGDGGNALAACQTSDLLVSDGSSLALLCAVDSTWALARLKSDGRLLGVERAPFARASDVFAHPSSFAATADGLVACGTLASTTDTHAAFSRWLPSGDNDLGFGDAGTLVLDGNTSAVGCVPVDGGVRWVGTVDGGLVLSSVLSVGALDPTFGDGGAVPIVVPGDAGAVPNGTRIIASGDDVLVLAGADGAATLSRFHRNGQLDASFGNGGRCELTPLGLGAAAAIALAPDGKLVVLASGYAELVLGRLWL